MPKNWCVMLVIAVCLIVVPCLAMAADGDHQPVVIESISRATEDAHMGQSWTLSVPTQHERDAWVFTFDNNERIGVGYRTKLFGGKDIAWQRFIVSGNDLSRDWQVQFQTLAATKNFSGLVSMSLAEGSKPTLFTDPQFRLAGNGDTSLWLQTQYFGEFSDLFDNSRWRVGPELKHTVGGITLKGRITFGSGDPQYQLWIVAPIGGK